MGGAGTNAVNRMIETGVQGVEFIAINTDAQALAMCEAEHKLRIGGELTRGLGGGNDPKVGRDSAMAAYEEIKALLKGSDMVFITAGEGGGTGTGAAPVVAEDLAGHGCSHHRGGHLPVLVRRQAPWHAGAGGRARPEAEGRHGDRGAQPEASRGVRQGHFYGRRSATCRRCSRQGVQGVCDLVTVPAS